MIVSAWRGSIPSKIITPSRLKFTKALDTSLYFSTLILLITLNSANHMAILTWLVKLLLE